MGSRVTPQAEDVVVAERYERLKVLCLSIAFFFIIAGYSLVRELKSSIFLAVVGKNFAPTAKILGLFVLTPAILLYSKLVDSMRRYELLMCCAAFFGLVGLIFTFFIGHATIGIANTDTHPYRLFGWLFYFFVEGYSPFLVSVFWAFANSVTSPEEGKRTYGLIVASSKLGGALSVGLAWALFAKSVQLQDIVSGVGLHQLVLGISSCLIMCVPVIIYILIKKVPGRYLHGYEAAYQLEKQKLEEEKLLSGGEEVAKKVADKKSTGREGVFAGLYMLLRYPYVLGIFGMVFFYEMVDSVIGFLRLSIGQAHAEDISGLSAFLFKTVFISHVVGMFVSYFGTGTLLSRLGERFCLLIIPLLSGLMLLYFMLDMTPLSLIIVGTVLKAMNYGFSSPVRESLYIPTVKEIKFKSKSWIDAFGSKFGKATGSTFNHYSAVFGSAFFLPAHAFLFASIVGLWFVTAFLLGKRFDQAISKNEVIGAEAGPGE